MKPTEFGSTIALEVLAASLAMRLAPDDLEWLWRELNQRVERKRLEVAGGQLPVLASYRDVWETVGDVT